MVAWREAPMPPLEGEGGASAKPEGFVRQLSGKTPQSARSGCQLPFQGRRGRFAPGRCAKRFLSGIEPGGLGQ